MLIREMRSEDKPRERFQESPKMASMTDLVAILLRTGRQGYSVMQLAQDVVDQLEQTVGINGYEDLHWRDLTDIKGIGPDKAVTICAAIELGRRLTYIYMTKESWRISVRRRRSLPFSWSVFATRRRSISSSPLSM